MRFIFISSSNGSRFPDANLDSRLPELERIETGSKTCFLFASEIDDRNLVLQQDLVGLIQGYARYFGLKEGVESHNRRFFQDLADGQFPMDNEVCSSFAAFVIDTRTHQVIAANDPIGFYPIYYYRDDSMLIVASHLLLFHRLADLEIDQTGVVQRLTGPEYCNFGARTVIKGVKRLLPGEYLRFDLSNNPIVEHKYDNSLFEGDFNTSLRDSAEKVWRAIKSESELCFEFDDEITLGLSGGMDSRILLASLPPEKKVTCYTYGSGDYYETKVARKCAEATGARFNSFSEAESLFPDRDVLRKYVLETEAVGINQWFSIIERSASDNVRKATIAIGESTEAIAGRNIQTYSSRSSRIKSFLGLKKVKWTPITKSNFEAWKIEKSRSVYKRIALDDRPFAADRDRILSETEDDLQQFYQRIEAHDVKFVELLDELFAWYTHARIPISNQLLLLRAGFSPVCPTMSTRSIRAISNVHPSFRLNSTLMDAIFRLPGLEHLSRIPTAQIPFVRYSFNMKLKLLIWGLRSKVDQLMIKVAALRGNVRARNRVLKSTNWALAYHKADLETVRNWFAPDHIGGSEFIRKFEDRASQKAHPLIPFDIVCAAGVNMELDIIRSNGEMSARALHDKHSVKQRA